MKSMTIDEAKKILGEENIVLPDESIEVVMRHLFALADKIIDNYLRTQPCKKHLFTAESLPKDR